MWVPDGKQVENDFLGKLVPTEVLFAFEEPHTFVCSDRDGNPLLASGRHTIRRGRRSLSLSLTDQGHGSGSTSTE
jgi:hypothetical protein